MSNKSYSSNYEFRSCPVCLAVSGLWVLLSLGIVRGYLDAPMWQLPVALLMGTSIMGVAGQGEKRFPNLALYPQAWKGSVLVVGVPLAYLAVMNLSVLTIILELLVMSALGFVLFRYPTEAKPKNDPAVEELQKKLKNCC